ncbi:hypothetical protein ACFQZ5_06860 [Dactylosporangium darangshiense]|uniref:hypothetical protein n=1 Tax=Dactylosporangium darangshiense TaxID=579108 RepID=UPI00363DE4B4
MGFGVLRSDDSVIAVATAMTLPRVVMAWAAPTATIVAALPTCSASHRPTCRPPAGPSEVVGSPDVVVSPMVVAQA